jgi:hypothetical protein
MGLGMALMNHHNFPINGGEPHETGIAFNNGSREALRDFVDGFVDESLESKQIWKLNE